MSDDEFYGFSRASGRYYKVTDWIELDDDELPDIDPVLSRDGQFIRICPTDGEEITEDEFPEHLVGTDHWVRFRDASITPFSDTDPYAHCA